MCFLNPFWNRFLVDLERIFDGFSMILEAQKEWNIDIEKSYIIGDSWRDIGAGINAGCKTILIDRKYNMPMLYKPDYIVNSLKEAESKILNS